VHRDPGVLALVVDPELALVEDVHAQAVLGDEVGLERPLPGRAVVVEAARTRVEDL